MRIGEEVSFPVVEDKFAIQVYETTAQYMAVIMVMPFTLLLRRLQIAEGGSDGDVRRGFDGSIHRGFHVLMNSSSSSPMLEDGFSEGTIEIQRAIITLARPAARYQAG